jgi:hypothetical protein
VPATLEPLYKILDHRRQMVEKNGQNRGKTATNQPKNRHFLPQINQNSAIIYTVY